MNDQKHSIDCPSNKRSQISPSELQIRRETPKDFNQIFELVASAFQYNVLDHFRPAWSICEALLVSFYRSYETYDNDLATVAEYHGKIVGHCIFTPYKLMLYGKQTAAVALSILSVHPGFQRMGIGTQLLKAGLDLVKQKGYPFCFLYGHESYYPRFGFKVSSFNEGYITFKRPQTNSDSQLTDSQVLPKYIPQLVEMHEATFKGVNLAIVPSDQITEWISVSPLVTSCVLTRKEQIIGYVRYISIASKGVSVKKIVARTQSDLVSCIEWLFNKFPSIAELNLPLYPPSPLLEGLRFENNVRPIPAGMICIIDQNCKSIARYFEELGSDPSKGGVIIWPSFFDYT